MKYQFSKMFYSNTQNIITLAIQTHVRMVEHAEKLGSTGVNVAVWLNTVEKTVKVSFEYITLVLQRPCVFVRGLEGNSNDCNGNDNNDDSGGGD